MLIPKSTCTILFDNLKAPITDVFFVLFVVAAVLSIIGNTVSSVVLIQPQMRCRSNKILTSLVLCDVLIGYAFLPYLAYLTYRHIRLNDCTLETIRDLVTVSIIGTSGINISLVAFDCYVMVTSLTSYNSYMSHKRINIAIALSWILPIFCATTRFVNPYFRAVILSILLLTPLVVLVVLYARMKSVITKMHNSPDVPEDNENLRNKHMVFLLISCYVICNIPVIVMLFVHTFYIQHDFVKSPSFQTAIMVLLFLRACNSIFNPIVYAKKHTAFRRCLKKLCMDRF